MFKLRIRILAGIVSIVMILSTLGLLTVASPTMSEDYQKLSVEEVRITDENGERLSDVERNIVTQTMIRPVGAAGFIDFDEAGREDMVEIVVQFVTPPAVALRLLYQDENPRARIISDRVFVEEALAAHETFWEQLAELPWPLPFVAGEEPTFEVFSEHHSLFNGVFIRTPRYKVEKIAALDEVFSVIPNERVQVDMPEYIPGFEADDFMAISMELFEVDYIHNTMGFTGEGVRIAVLDSGIDHTHPVFQAVLDPETGRLPGWNTFYDNDDLTDYMGHGTHVAAIAIALAPKAQLWDYKVFCVTGWSFDSVLRGIEAAHAEGVDVMNLSLGWFDEMLHPWSVATNLAMLDGIVVVNAAGNSGMDWFGDELFYSMDAPGSASLPIAVASGTLGGIMDWGDTISDFSSRGPVPATYHIKPDIVAPGDYIVSAVPGGGYEAWSGTSMAAPHIAGFAALMIQRFPAANSNEIKARLMNSSRPLADHENPNVFVTGAGFVQPKVALGAEAYATVRHRIPWLDGDSFLWREETMASMSFGWIVERRYSNPMTVTIHNPGDEPWSHEVIFNSTQDGVSMNLVESNTSGVSHTYTFQMEFSEENIWGWIDGNVIFTNGEQQITLPFGMRYDAMESRFIEINPRGEHHFHRALVGYDTVRERLVSVTNWGNVPIENISIELEGAHPEAFELSRDNILVLELWEIGRFTVAPRLGLTPGVYEATVVVSFVDRGEIRREQFGVRFQVDAEAETEIELRSLETRFDWMTMEVYYHPLWQASEWSFGSSGNYRFPWNHNLLNEFTDILILNTGNQPTGELTVSLIEGNEEEFYIIDFVRCECCTLWAEGWHVNEFTIDNLEPGEHHRVVIFALSLGEYTDTVMVTGDKVVTQYFDVRNTVVGRDMGIELHLEDGIDFGVIPYGFDVVRRSRVWATNRGERALNTFELEIDLPWDKPFEILVQPRYQLGLSYSIATDEKAVIYQIYLMNTSSLPVGRHVIPVSIFSLWGDVAESFYLQFEIVDFGDRPITLDPGDDVDLATTVEGYYYSVWCMYTPCDYRALIRVLNTGGQSLEDTTYRLRLEGNHSQSFELVNKWDGVASREFVVDNFSLEWFGQQQFFVRPVLDLPPGVYEARVVLTDEEDIYQSFDLRFEVEPIRADAKFYPDGNHDFGSIDVGEQANPYWVQIRNRGNITVEDLSIEISGTHANSFRLSRRNISFLQWFVPSSFRDEVLQTGAFLVVTPKEGLAEGRHTATVTLSGGDIQPQSFEVLLVVGDPPSLCEDCNEYPCICDDEYAITFHMYTANQRILDEFDDYTIDVDGYAVIVVPMELGTVPTLEELTNIGNIYGTIENHGYAFWGWFDNETLDESGRRLEGLRRPLLDDKCVLAYLLERIEDGTAIFEDGNINMYGVWIRFGDVDDNGIINMSDLNLLQRYINFSQVMGVVLNEVAANVIVDDVVNMADLSLLQRCINFRHIVPVVLGARP